MRCCGGMKVECKYAESSKHQNQDSALCIYQKARSLNTAIKHISNKNRHCTLFFVE